MNVFRSGYSAGLQFAVRQLPLKRLSVRLVDADLDVF